MSDKKIISPFSEQIASIFTSKFSGEHAMLSELQFKGTVSRDFRPSVIFISRLAG
jgi:hypothetical protein